MNQLLLSLKLDFRKLRKELKTSAEKSGGGAASRVQGSRRDEHPFGELVHFSFTGLSETNHVRGLVAIHLRE